MMKRFLILIFLFSTIVLVQAEKKIVKLKSVPKKENTDMIFRAPINLPIEVEYDDESMTIQIFSATDIEAEVSVYDAYGELEGYSPFLNTIISVTESDYHTIVIEGETWIASGIVE